MLDQGGERVEGLDGDRDDLVAAQQAPRLQIQPKPGEFTHSESF